MTKINFKSLALCAAMLSFGFADNNIDVFGGELGGKVYIYRDSPNKNFRNFGSRYNTDELIAKAKQCKEPLELGIKITYTVKDAKRIVRCGGIFYLGDKYQGLFSLSDSDIWICFKVNFNDINHYVFIGKMPHKDKNVSYEDKYTFHIRNFKGVQESEQTLANALRQIGLTLPILCKGLLKLQDNVKYLTNKDNDVGSTFTL